MKLGLIALAASSALAAAAAQPASAPPPARPKVTCDSVETPRGTLIIDRILFVFFDPGSASITRQAAAYLDGYAARYDAPGYCHVFVTGHADGTGTAAVNQALSRRRAQAVVRYLRARGLRAPMTVSAVGATRPLVDKRAGAAEPENRRVELSVGEPP